MQPTNLTYSLKWLTDKVDNGEGLEYIFFWGHSNKQEEPIGKYCFSQWFELPFVVEGVQYRTAEHWMMANKVLVFNDKTAFDKIVAAATPAEVKKLGRGVVGFDNEVWDAQKMQIVVTGNRHKFEQHPNYLNYLLQTGDKIIVEASPVDRIWGIGLAQDAKNIYNPHSWKGENLLGFALMEVRDILAGQG